MSDNICPRVDCGKPIADTAYVCHDCVAKLIGELRKALALWPSIEDAVGRRLIVDRPTAPAKAVDRMVYLGPWCYGVDCEHQSCARSWRTVTHQRDEPPISREDLGIINLAAVETAWVSGNTFTTWARHVSEERGIPIPLEARPRRKPTPTPDVVANPTDTDRPGRCHCCDFDVRWCPNATERTA